MHAQFIKKGIVFLHTGKLPHHVAINSSVNRSHHVTTDIWFVQEAFEIERLGVVGGPTINTAFLDAGLLDEVILLIGAGIDGRASFPPVFHRADNGQAAPTPLKLVEARTYASGAVLIRYKTK